MDNARTSVVKDSRNIARGIRLNLAARQCAHTAAAGQLKYCEGETCL